MAAIAIEVGDYSLSKGVKAALRTNIDATITTLSATVSDYLPDDLQGSGANVYLSDLRLPPQARQWIVIGVALAENVRAITLGQQISRFEVTLTAGVQGFTKARSGVDPSPTFEDATWQTAGLLSRAADYCLERYLIAETTVYNCQRLRTARVPIDPTKPNLCAVQSVHAVWMRTRAAIGE